MMHSFSSAPFEGSRQSLVVLDAGLGARLDSGSKFNSQANQTKSEMKS